MSKNFFDRLDELDLLIQSSPTDARFKTEIKPLLRDEASTFYFFEHIHDQAWLPILFEEGVFKRIPRPKRDKKSRAVSVPVWPASKYLVRMARTAKNENNSTLLESVIGIALTIPKNDNINVYEDLVDIALSAPTDAAIGLVWALQTWFTTRHLGSAPRKVVDLILHLAKNRESPASLRLARGLFAVERGEANRSLSRDTSTFLASWNYDQALQTCFPTLVEVAGLNAVWFLCELLDRAIRFSSRNLDQRGPEDFSYIWRPAVEDHPQNLDRDIRHSLVRTIRTSGESVLELKTNILDDLIAGLESRSWFIFLRIALHLLRIARPRRLDLVARYLSNHTYFSEIAIRHEYSLLLQSMFEYLDPDTKEKILGFIQQGPPLSFFRQHVKSNNGREPSEQEVFNYVAQWKLNWLSFLKDHLDSGWIDNYNEMMARARPSDHPEFPSYMSGGAMIMENPLSVPEIRSKNPDELVQFLRQWRPTGGPDDISELGVANLLTELVASAAVIFAPQARKFEQVAPIYIRGFIDGFAEAARKGLTFEWGSVLEFILWVAGQTNFREETSSSFDNDWRWARQSSAKLLSTGFNKHNNEILLSDRELVWSIVTKLAADPDPTPEREQGMSDDTMDASTLSVNSVRGEALHSVFRYGLWIRNNFEKQGFAFKGMADIPEVASLLSEHLNLEKDASLAVRTTYGQWFPWLTLLDRQWASEHVDKIFPIDPLLARFRNAAWRDYVVFSSPYDAVLPLLQREYERAIAELKLAPTDESSYADPNLRLAEHLATYYWRGQLGLSEPNDLLRRFFESPNLAARAHAVGFIGRSLENTKGELLPEIIQRLKTLWSWRLEVLSNFRHQSAEIDSFGWWFISNKFPEEWAINTLKSTLLLSGNIEPSDKIVEKLNELAVRFPDVAAECVSLMASAEPYSWKVNLWKSKALSILKHAVSSNDAATRLIGKRAANVFGERGFLEFRQVAK